MHDNDHQSDPMGMSHDPAFVSHGPLASSARRIAARSAAGRPRGSGSVQAAQRRSALPGRAPAEAANDVMPPPSQPRLKRRDESRQLELLAQLREELLVLALQSPAALRELEKIERELGAGVCAVDEWLDGSVPGQEPREWSPADFESWLESVRTAARAIDAALGKRGRSHGGPALAELDAAAWPAEVEREVALQREALVALVRDMPLREAAASRLINAARSGFAPRAGSVQRAPSDLVRRWEAVDRQARAAEAQFVQANQGLVALVVKRYLGVGLSYSDLMQEGNIGLLRAVEKFDCRRGCRFSTYATWWIRQAVRRALANQARTIRLPVHTADARYALRQASSKLEARLGREASSGELAEHMGVAASKVGRLMNLVSEPVSLEAPRGDGGDTCLYDSLSDSGAEDPATCAHDRQVKGHLEQLVAALPPREAKMVRLRFGLDGRHERTLDEVGHEFGLTRERVRQLLEKALAKLRNVVPDDWRAVES